MLLQRISGLIHRRQLPDIRFWLDNRDLLWRELNPARSGAWHVVCQDPPIVYVMEFEREVDALAKRLRRRPAWLLVSNPWIPRTTSEARALEQRTAAIRSRYPDVSIVYLCNEPDEAARLSAAGLHAEFCHQNALLDESLYRPLPGVVPIYDAIYIAQLIAYKRHYLAREVRSLLVKTYLSEASRDREYMREAVGALRHARWIYRCTDAEVCAAINTCRVGLCLSAAEGGMYSSVEYLLCGLPVVTTPSVGGRGAFFDDECVLTVEPEPMSVRLGVEEMIRRDLDPRGIRESVLSKLRPHRAKFVEIVNHILSQSGVAPTYQWGDRFINKMWKPQPFTLVRRECPIASAARR
jgi:glycosyltransferase involved in cell wall biosynthesis